MYAHRACVKTWIASRGSNNSRCERCHAEYNYVDVTHFDNKKCVGDCMGVGKKLGIFFGDSILQCILVTMTIPQVVICSILHMCEFTDMTVGSRTTNEGFLQGIAFVYIIVSTLFVLAMSIKLWFHTMDAVPFPFRNFALFELSRFALTIVSQGIGMTLFSGFSPSGATFSAGALVLVATVIFGALVTVVSRWCRRRYTTTTRELA